MRISPHAPLFFVYLKHDFLFLLLLLLLVEGEQVIRQAAPAAPVSNAAGSKLLQRVNESKYSAWPPTYQTVRLGQRVVTKKWTYKEVQISNIRSSRQNTQNLKLVDVHFSTVSIWSFQVDINHHEQYSSLSCFTWESWWTGYSGGAPGDKDDKSEASDKARGEEVGF